MNQQLPREVSTSRTSGTFVPHHIRLRARQAIADAVVRGCEVLGLPLFMPACSFDLRGTTAGQALCQFLGRKLVGATVRINGQLLLDNEQEMLEETLPHEVAHILTDLKHGRGTKPHGAEWQRVMLALGKQPTRTHEMETTPARTVARDFVYRCSCKLHRLTAIRHRKIQSRKASYRCNDCMQPLQYEGKARPQPSLPAGSRAAPASAPAAPLPSVPSVAAPVPAAPYAPALPSPTLPRPVPPPAPASRPCPVVLAPTERQTEYALALARRHGVAIPPQVRYDRELLSRWISQHAGHPVTS